MEHGFFRLERSGNCHLLLWLSPLARSLAVASVLSCDGCRECCAFLNVGISILIGIQGCRLVALTLIPRLSRRVWGVFRQQSLKPDYGLAYEVFVALASGFQAISTHSGNDGWIPNPCFGPFYFHCSVCCRCCRCCCCRRRRLSPLLSGRINMHLLTPEALGSRKR